MEISRLGEFPEDWIQHLAKMPGRHATLGSIAKRYHMSPRRQRHTGDAGALSGLPQAGPGLQLLLFLCFNYASLLVWVPRHQGRLRRVVG